MEGVAYHCWQLGDGGGGVFLAFADLAVSTCSWQLCPQLAAADRQTDRQQSPVC